jgi:membrane protein DedA with SNARE-associated domain
MIATLLGLAAATLLSEDAAALTAGWLVSRGSLDAGAAVLACAAGIWIGDVGLWAAGRALSRAEWCRQWCVQRLPVVGGRALALAVDEPAAIVASRFLPGTRLPLYVAAGAVGARPAVFFGWTLAAVLVWTPLVVLGAAWFAAGAAAVLAAARLAQTSAGRRYWQRVSARVVRWTRPEFWPTALVYAPIAPWILWQAVRNGGVGSLGAANPGFEDGGFVGESKFAILSALPREWTLPSRLVGEGVFELRVRAFDAALAEVGGEYPVILKPDVGQKGVGVRRIASRDEALAYLAAEPGDVIVQRYHPGPFEVGIFYYRRPDESRGRIFSVTDKRFPSVVGDGESPLEALLLAHPRFRLQVPLFLKRHDGARVLADGERLTLVTSGNHCQGAIFLDGQGLITPALEARIDQIARAVPGFYVGRFDVRYANPAAFARGENLAIVELNGVTSESTNIYDPSYGAINAWKTLARQWQIVFEIGAANRARGAAPVRVGRLARLVLDFWRSRPPMPVAS